MSARRLHLVAQSVEPFQRVRTLLIGVEAEGYGDLAVVRHHIGAGAAVDDSAVVSDVPRVGHLVDRHHLPGRF